MVASWRSKWAAGKARGGRISKLIRNRRATQPPAHFHRNPLGRGRLAVFPRCSLLTYRFRYARRSRLEKQPTDLRRKVCLFRGQDTRLGAPLNDPDPKKPPMDGAGIDKNSKAKTCSVGTRKRLKRDSRLVLRKGKNERTKYHR